MTDTAVQQALHEACVVVAIDGPAGTGKTTVARKLAERLDLEYLDTGAMYRAVTLAVLDRGVELSDEAQLAAVARDVDIDVGSDGVVTLDDVTVSSAIRSRRVNENVSVVASVAEVRRELVARQREWVQERGGGVLEGRDIASVVFPDAVMKIFLTAREDVRAMRRVSDSASKEDVVVDVVAAELRRRDQIDSGRNVDPLRLVDDAVEVDTSDLTIDEVVARLTDLFFQLYSARFGAPHKMSGEEKNPSNVLAADAHLHTTDT